jgi:hypothetical protein
VRIEMPAGWHITYPDRGKLIQVDQADAPTILFGVYFDSGTA